MRENGWTANTTDSSGAVIDLRYVQVDAADDALTAVRRLQKDRDAYRGLYQLERGRLIEVGALLSELDIPTHCASGQVLTFAQRVTIAIHFHAGD